MVCVKDNSRGLRVSGSGFPSTWRSCSSSLVFHSPQHVDSSEPRGDLAEVLALPLEAVLLAPAERLKHSRPLKDLELQDLFRNLKNPESTAAAFYPEPNCSTKPFTNLFVEYLRLPP